MPVSNKLLFYLSVISPNNVAIYEQVFSKEQMDRVFINTITAIALGLKNTMGAVLSSIKYLDYNIHFKQGLNFTAILVTPGSKQLDELVANIFESFQKDTILETFSNYARDDMKLESKEIQERITRIILNVSFFHEISDWKRELRS